MEINSNGRIYSKDIINKYFGTYTILLKYKNILTSNEINELAGFSDLKKLEIAIKVKLRNHKINKIWKN